MDKPVPLTEDTSTVGGKYATIGWSVPAKWAGTGLDDNRPLVTGYPTIVIGSWCRYLPNQQMIGPLVSRSSCDKPEREFTHPWGECWLLNDGCRLIARGSSYLVRVLVRKRAGKYQLVFSHEYVYDDVLVLWHPVHWSASSAGILVIGFSVVLEVVLRGLVRVPVLQVHTVEEVAQVGQSFHHLAPQS